MRLTPTTLYFLAACTAGILSGCNADRVPEALAPLPSKPADATISIRATKKTGPVQRAIFGNNLEAGDTKGVFGTFTNLALVRTGDGVWDDVKREPNPAVTKLAKEAGITRLRYPGGCLAHNFDWEKTVGPVAARGDWRFGLDEYLAVCKAWGAEPLITVAEYFGAPQDAADLVEYLNSPAAPGHPWAIKRAENGHSEPYGVKWFELGNESNHGNHRGKLFSPDQYAEYAKTTAAAMRAVDPSIQIGIVTAAGQPVDDPWNAGVLRGAGAIADFVVVHFYAVNYAINDPNAPEDRLMRACMAAGEQLERAIASYHASIRENAGRDLPIALTEYNAGFVQDKPKRYRYSYGAALFSADFVRVLLDPSSGVEMANYWHFINGYWGMIQGSGDNFNEMPAFPLYRLWARHFGSELLDVKIDAPRIDFEGANSVSAASGDTYAPGGPAGGKTLLPPGAIRPSEAGGVRTTPGNPGSLTIELANVSGARYPTLLQIPRPADARAAGVDYLLSFEARYVPASGSGQVGLGLADPRGWDATASAAAIPITPTTDWKPFSGKLEAHHDAPGVNLLVRVEPSAQGLSTRIEIRNMTLRAVHKEQNPGYFALTASASASADGGTLYLIVFNKSTDRDLETQINLDGFIARPTASRWVVNGGSLADIGVSPGDTSKPQSSVREVETGAATLGYHASHFRHIFPAHSMTALEFKRQAEPMP